MHKAYASTFVAYLLNALQEPQQIRQIILFGSAARGDAKRDSDIDVFIELKKKDKKLEQAIEKVKDSFFMSREALLFKTRGIENPFHVIAGNLDEWKDLRKSIESTGIVLYGPYTEARAEGKKYLLISWERVRKNRGAFLNAVYGFSVKGKRYLGLLDKVKGKKVGKSCILLPVSEADKFLARAKHYKVNARVWEVYASL